MQNMIKEWGSLDQYIRTHGEFGQELKQIGERSLISFTEDLEVAKYFAGPDGIVIQLKLPKSKFIQQTLKDSSELERLIINGEKP